MKFTAFVEDDQQIHLFCDRPLPKDDWRHKKATETALPLKFETRFNFTFYTGDPFVKLSVEEAKELVEKLTSALEKME